MEQLAIFDTKEPPSNLKLKACNEPRSDLDGVAGWRGIHNTTFWIKHLLIRSAVVAKMASCGMER